MQNEQSKTKAPPPPRRRAPDGPLAPLAGQAPPPPGPASSVEVLPLAEMVVPPEYQRGLKAHRSGIRKRWDPKSAGLLKVGRRPDGTLVLIDGQQRRDVMLSMGLTCWPCEVVAVSGPAEEAAVFTAINGAQGRRNLTPADLFRAALAAGDPDAQAVVRAAEAAGLRLAQGRKRTGERAGELGCVSTLHRACRLYGEDAVRRLLAVVAAAWPGDPAATAEIIPAALCRLYGSQADRIDDARLTAVLSRVTPRQLRADAAAQLGDRRAAMARTIATLYNRRLVSAAKRLRVSEAPGGEGE